MRNTLLVWIGLMGMAATGGVLLLLRTYPRAFVESGPAAAWPWRRDAAKSARVRGGLLIACALVSVSLASAGLALLLF